MEIISHLLPSHVEYFSKWSRMIAVEAIGDTDAKPKTSSLFWCRTSEEQEKAGNDRGPGVRYKFEMVSDLPRVR